MIRKLVDYKKLSHEVAALLIENYPYGYGDEDIITFKNANNELIEAVEVRTSDTIYLIKISKSLSDFISNFEENIEKELESEPETALEGVTTNDMKADFDVENELLEEEDF